MTTVPVTAPAAAAARPAVPPGHQHFLGALRSEWVKLRSVRSTFWSVLATVAAGIGLCVLATSSEAAHWRHAGVVDRALFDPTSISLTGLLFGQLSIGVLGVLVMSAEYGTGTIRASLAAVPRRPTVLVAKVVVFGALALVVSEVVAVASFGIGQAVLSGSAPTASLGQGATVRAVVGGGLYLTVLGLLALGLATLVRHTAGAIFTFVAILLILPLVVSAFPASIGHPIGRYLPAVIGSAMTTTKTVGHPDFLPSFPPWQGFALLCGYALGALVAGAVVMVRRDP